MLGKVIDNGHIYDQCANSHRCLLLYNLIKFERYKEGGCDHGQPFGPAASSVEAVSLDKVQCPQDKHPGRYPDDSLSIDLHQPLKNLLDIFFSMSRFRKTIIWFVKTGMSLFRRVSILKLRAAKRTPRRSFSTIMIFKKRLCFCIPCAILNLIYFLVNKFRIC